VAGDSMTPAAVWHEYHMTNSARRLNHSRSPPVKPSTHAGASAEGGCWARSGSSCWIRGGEAASPCTTGSSSIPAIRASSRPSSATWCALQWACRGRTRPGWSALLGFFKRIGRGRSGLQPDSGFTVRRRTPWPGRTSRRRSCGS